MDITGRSILPKVESIRLREGVACAGFFFPAIAWPGDVYTRLERVE